MVHMEPIQINIMTSCTISKQIITITDFAKQMRKEIINNRVV